MNSRGGLKRLFDLTAALCGLILLAPVLLALALSILVLDGRPVLFRQWRVGKNGRLFQILKFRTMAEVGCAAPITAANDRRITALGRRLRRLKLDELPQLINVLKGEMSLIGPRPEVPKFVDTQNIFWKIVLQVRPGITDLASLLYRDEEDILAAASDPEDVYRRDILPAKLNLNVKYLTRHSWRKDARVLWLTACYSLFPGNFDRRQIAEEFDLLESAAPAPRDAVEAGELHG
jgi:lipopolysaccharide/colanic/teichoic acid biosynthesis glycosyltransferase